MKMNRIGFLKRLGFLVALPFIPLPAKEKRKERRWTQEYIPGQVMYGGGRRLGKSYQLHLDAHRSLLTGKKVLLYTNNITDWIVQHKLITGFICEAKIKTPLGFFNAYYIKYEGANNGSSLYGRRW